MSRNGRPAAAARIGDFAGRSSALSEQRQDSASRRISKGSESPVCCHVGQNN
jgi:hypothetical protein